MKRYLGVMPDTIGFVGTAFYHNPNDDSFESVYYYQVYILNRDDEYSVDEWSILHRDDSTPYTKLSYIRFGTKEELNGDHILESIRTSLSHELDLYTCYQIFERRSDCMFRDPEYARRKAKGIFDLHVNNYYKHPTDQTIMNMHAYLRMNAICFSLPHQMHEFTDFDYRILDDTPLEKKERFDEQMELIRDDIVKMIPMIQEAIDQSG